MKNLASEYAKSGVNLDASDKAKSMLKELVEKTHNDSVLGVHGGFGGLYSLKELTGTNKVLVGSSDGVGTKLKLAFLTNKHNTIGQDLVNHLVDDILCCGARPMFFFDYLGLGKLSPDTVVDIVRGLTIACQENNMALLGGETAEMPGFYSDGEYDVAGFIVGWVDSDKIIDGSSIKPRDKIIGLASTGLHTNGYSLARRAFFDIAGMQTDDTIEETGKKVSDELLTVHRSYLDIVSPLLDEGIIKGIAHLTGGGFYGNINRIIPDGISAVIDTSVWEPPGVFKAIARIASVSDEEMYRVFNMGIGMTLICDKDNSQQIFEKAKQKNVDVYDIGFCETGKKKVQLRL
ncbi:MAG: phosphoribosylformylglycinamidine cyclo-ligase [candidate division Zixibacteria bacterium]|nr:phosphoribosylformylglycinamidine cyclo-ligase [candidate division Zixibacteria bacterium]